MFWTPLMDCSSGISTESTNTSALAPGYWPEMLIRRLPSGVPAGALAGTYAGVGANASICAGAGANILVGGSGNAFSLQPISIEDQIGINIAGGVTTVTLKPAP